MADASLEMLDLLCRKILLLVLCHACPWRAQRSCQCIVPRPYVDLFLPLSTGGRWTRGRSPNTADRGIDGSVRGLGVQALDKSVQKYYSAALTSATKRTYQVGRKRYEDFCIKFNVPSIPISESVMCYFVAYLGDQGLMPSSIKSYLSAVRQWQISEGYPEPQFSLMPCLKQVVKGVGVTRGKEGRPTRCKLPITPEILRQLGREEKKADWEMYWEASLLRLLAGSRVYCPLSTSL